MKKMVFWGFAALIGVIGIALIAATQLDSPNVAAPADGPGYAATTLSVSHRAAPLTVHVWYPAGSGGQAEWLGRNALFLGQPVRRDAAPQAGPHPVALMSHGSGGNGPRMGWLAAALVKGGWIVVAPDHPGTMSQDSLPSETVKVWTRTEDMQAIAASLDALLPAGVEASDTLAAVGFSIGGHTSLGLAGVRLSKDAFVADCANRTDSNCGWLKRGGIDLTTIDAALYEADLSLPGLDAAVAIDPAPPAAMTAESLTAVAVPVLILNLGNPTPVGVRSDAVAASITGAQYQVFGGTGHFAMLTECSPLGGIVLGLAVRADENICDGYSAPRAQVQGAVAERIVAFLSELR